ncbi:hypothetical protein HHK36_007105 [Tetracentron sinense]|uniref:Uncharacterized protein n=1 Tax=Tetracentron sinense TaxID=13715 RepID=A0A834ZM20_TETSI|nr:hypothetical protein HHK36_007105 [Tetracentron sinense]
MPHRTRPMTSLLVFTGVNVILLSTITPVYDFVSFLPYWEQRSQGNFNPGVAFQAGASDSAVLVSQEPSKVGEGEGPGGAKVDKRDARRTSTGKEGRAR